MVEYNLAKINVEGSSPFFRFYLRTQRQDLVFPYFLGNNFRIDVINLNKVIID